MNIKCPDCGTTINPTANTHAMSCPNYFRFSTGANPIQANPNSATICVCPHHGEKRNKPCDQDDPKCPFHPSDDFTKRDGALTPLSETLQTNCSRCNMRWIIHNCPQYPKLLDAKEMIKKLARGAILKETAENADYFTSIKCDGEEFNVYVNENNIIRL